MKNGKNITSRNGKWPAAIIIIALLVTVISPLILIGCTEKTVNNLAPMLNSEDIAYLDEIQGKDSLYFEWLNNAYSKSKPTLIVIHGETTGAGEKKFSMDLDPEVYTFQKDKNDADYVVADNIGYRAEGLKLNISQYWLVTSQWNVAIFHWERFADESNPEDVLVKLFTVPKMRYVSGRDEDGNATYETSKVPRNSLTEVFAALYVKEMEDKLSGNEIRFVGNGVGADLALSAAHYLALYQEDNQLAKDYLPERIALCDPYLSIEDLHFTDDKIDWADINTTSGMLSVANDMLEKVADYGAAIEMIESNEISTRNVTGSDGQEMTQNVSTYAYDIEKSALAELTFGKLKQKVAYLELRESYSTLFPEAVKDVYKGYKRIALDWYLYSIIGSDDSGNAGGSSAIGYPREITNFADYYTYTGFNWAPNATRPMVNNRQLNSDSSGYTSRGKNYSVSAWTPTVYTRALRGISFKMEKYSKNTSLTSAHGNAIYQYTDYTLARFRSENFQVSDQTDYTLVCGYVYVDTNGDKLMNDGYNGISGVELQAVITTGSGNDVKSVASFTVTTDKSGFYVIKLNDKTMDSEGNWSKNGYSFSTSHTLSLTLIPSSHDYVSISSALSGLVFYQSVGGHNFSGYTSTITLNNYTGGAINISNCLVKPDEKN